MVAGQQALFAVRGKVGEPVQGVHIPQQIGRPGGLRVREPPPRHGLAHVADAAVQRRQRQRERRRLVQRGQRIAGQGEVRRGQRRHRRGDAGQEGEVRQRAHRPRPVRVREHPPHLRPDPFAADRRQAVGLGANRLRRGRVEFEPQRRREPHGAQQPQLVLFHALPGVADRAQHAGLQVGHAADVVDHRAGRGVLEQAVDREVPAAGVRLGRAEPHRVRPAAVGIALLLAEGGDLDLLRGGMLAAVRQHDDDAEALAHRQRAALPEELPHPGRRGVGGDVVVLRPLAQQAVPHAPAGEQREVPGAGQLGGDLRRERPVRIGGGGSVVDRRGGVAGSGGRGERTARRRGTQCFGREGFTPRRRGGGPRRSWNASGPTVSGWTWFVRAPRFPAAVSPARRRANLRTPRFPRSQFP